MTEPKRAPSCADGSECRRPAARAAAVLPEGVSDGLRVVIDSVFGARLPMFVAWGRDLRMVYNDACAALLTQMEPAEELMRSSGHYGPRVPVPDDADAQTRLLAFIGRDPLGGQPRGTQH